MKLLGLCLNLLQFIFSVFKSCYKLINLFQLSLPYLKNVFFGIYLFFSILITYSCSPVNSPYPLSEISQKVYFSSFSQPPKKLDPVISYSSDEWQIISLIYEPPLNYSYFSIPYKLQPNSLAKMPQIIYLNKDGIEVSKKYAEFTKYVFTIRRDLYFTEHPAFVKDKSNNYLYHNLNLQEKSFLNEEVYNYQSPYDFKKQAYRKVTSDDFIYPILRMAGLKNASPILSAMEQYIVGLDNFKKQVSVENFDYKKLRFMKIDGVKKNDDYSYSITIKGIYPQFLYWLTMNFFAPIAWEVEQFYKQPSLEASNINLNNFPVGTGPFKLEIYNPNWKIELIKNKLYKNRYFPILQANDLARIKSEYGIQMAKELQSYANKPLPMLDKVVLTLEKESNSYWNKFLQGYYDSSGISSENFMHSINISHSGGMSLNDELIAKNIKLNRALQPSIFYYAFNMLDKVVGGYKDRQKKLRYAISIAMDLEEYITIFLNNRAQVAHSPIPSGIFGYQKNINSFSHIRKQKISQRKSISYAKKLLTEAGYPNGIDAKTNKPLKIYFDAVGTGVDSGPRLKWMQKQFKKIGLDLVIRNTDYNRFQEKVKKGSTQIFFWGWNADYPDPENFLQLLYSSYGSVITKGAGINSANYSNPKFDELFQQIKLLSNNPMRANLIKQAIAILQEDAPWIWGMIPESYSLQHSWVKANISNPIINDKLKYLTVDSLKRKQYVLENNQINKSFIWYALFAILILLFWLLTLKLKKQYFLKIFKTKSNR